jgi:hypothetical protein
MVPAPAEVSEPRIARRTSVAFPQFNAMKHQRLVEKHAAALGVPSLTVTFATFYGPVTRQSVTDNQPIRCMTRIRKSAARWPK